MQNIYQDLYEKSDYGSATAGKCPGVRYYSHYYRFLKGKIIDLGCGRGDTVRFLREKKFEADGIDYIDLKNDMIVGDITEDLDLKKYDTALCCDVLEHFTKEELPKVFANLAKCKHIIATVHTGNSYNFKHAVDLHLTQESVEWWETEMLKFFKVERRIALQPKRWLIIGRKK